MARGAALAAAVAASLAGAPPASRGQVTQTPGHTVVRIGGGEGNRYEREYGRAYFCSLDDAENWPCQTPVARPIRTVGRLGEKARRPDADDASAKGRPVTRYSVCGERQCVDIEPVEELRDVWNHTLPFWTAKNVEIVGAFGTAESTGRPAGAPSLTGGLTVWEVSLAPERNPQKDARDRSLEPLVRSPAVWAGRIVTVEGRFRGSNLFEDLAPESRRGKSDWVLQEGPFSVWVTGKAPRGQGFALDPASRSDCLHRLRVEGMVETHNGYVYLRAKTVMLLGRGAQHEPEG